MTFHPPEHRSPRGRVPPAPFGFWSPSLTWAHLCPPGQDQREELLSDKSPMTSRGHQLCSLQRSLLKVDTSGHRCSGSVCTQILRPCSGQSALGISPGLGGGSRGQRRWAPGRSNPALNLVRRDGSSICSSSSCVTWSHVC